MKYIRTKDGTILSLDDYNYSKKCHLYRPNKKYLKRLGIDFTMSCWCFDDEYDLIPPIFAKLYAERIKKEECRFADTIEELCDRFVLARRNIIVVSEEHTQYKLEGGDIWFDITKHELKLGIYGAIWTNKGLIYVAKLNKKGELELL